jgi:adenylosuccinate lyase
MDCKTLRCHMIDSNFFSDGFSTEEARTIFCDIRRLQRWLDVEVALAISQANLGIIPLSAAEELTQTAQLHLFNLEKVYQPFKNTGHSLIPLLVEWQEVTSADSGAFIHYGATEQDIRDTAQSLEVRDILFIIERDLFQVIEELIGLARKTRSLVMVGRSHGRHALPTTLGLKIAVWLDEMLRNGERLNECSKRVLVSQLFGGVGTMAAFDDKGLDLLNEFSKRLQLSAPHTAWHSARDRMAELLSFMAILAGGLGNIANEIFQLTRDEICELEGPLYFNKIGSTTIPYNHNPGLCEQVVVLSKLIKNQTHSGFDALINEHECDYRSLRLERVSIPETSLMLCSALNLSKAILKNLIIHENNIRANLDRSVFHTATEAVSFAGESNTNSQKAYELVHNLIMKAYGENRPLRELLEENPDITNQLDSKGLTELLKHENHIGLAPKLTELTITAAEEWLASSHPRDLSENTCPLADKHGECIVPMREQPD